MNKEILWISGTSVVRGAEYVFGDYLESSKFTHKIVLVTSTQQEVVEYYNQFELKKIITLDNMKFVKVSGYFNLLGKVKKILKYLTIKRELNEIIKNKYEVVVANNSRDIIYSNFFKNHYFIQYVHDIIDTFLLVRTFKYFDKYVSKYIVVSDAVKCSLLKIGILENKIELVYNGLSLNSKVKNKYYDKNSLSFGFVGNLEDRKNPIDALKIVHHLQKKVKSIKLTFVFGGCENIVLQNIKQYIKKYNLNVELINNISRDKMDEFYQSIDFLIITSKKDPLPTVVLESMNNSTPVIGFSVDGVKEMVKETVNGYLINNINDVNTLCNNILRVDQNIYNRLSHNAYETIINKFNINRKVNKLDKILFKTDIE